MTSTMKRVAIYTRVSSEDQAREGTSLNTQRERLLAHAESHGWPVAGHYEDAGVSGAKAQRPALDRLLADVGAGLVDIVLVTKWDRMARSLNHMTTLWDVLDKAGVQYVAADEPETSGERGEFVRNIMASVAQEERRVIRERTESGRLARVREGGWSGGEPPFGFRVEGKGKAARLVLNDAEAALIRHAVSLLLDQGMGPLDVVQDLNADGYTPRKAPRWSLTGLRTMLTRGPFGGVWTYAKPASGTRLEPIQVAIPEMLPPERFAALKAHLAATSHVRTSGPVHPLTGRVIGPCGHPFHGVARRDRGNRRYRCRYAKDTGRGWTCDTPSVLADEMDARAWEHVLAMLADPDRLRGAAEDHLGILADAAGVEADALERAEANVATIERALRDALSSGLKLGLDLTTIEGTMGNLKADLAQARAHLGAVAAMAANTRARANQVNEIQAVADLARTTLENADAQTRANVFRLLDVRVSLLQTTRVGQSPTDALNEHHPGGFVDLTNDTRSHPGGIPVRWRMEGAVAHGTLLAALAPREGNDLSFANRTSR